MNHKKLCRLYREEGLTVRRRGGRKRATRHAGADRRCRGPEPALVAGLRLRRASPRPALPHPGHRRRLHPRVPGAGGRHLALRRAGRARADALIARRGRPAMIVSDNGTELTSQGDPGMGQTGPASSGTTSRPASRCRTPSWRASTAGCATSAFCSRGLGVKLNRSIVSAWGHASVRGRCRRMMGIEGEADQAKRRARGS